MTRPRHVEVLHRTKNRTITVTRGPAYRPPSRRPRSRHRVARTPIAFDIESLFTRSLTPAARAYASDPTNAALMLRALRLTRLGYSRTIVIEDGALACSLPEPSRISWRQP